MQDIFNNKFHDALNGDVDPRIQSNNSYISAKNIDLVGTDNMYVAKNIAGTEEVNTIIEKGITDLDVHILGAFKCVGLYNDVYGSGIQEYNNSIAIFLYNDTDTNNPLHQIYLYDILRDKLHLAVNTATLNFNESLIIDTVVYTEQGESSIFFVDGLNGIRRLKCIIDSSSPILFEESVTLRRFSPTATLSVDDVVDGGSVYSGSYQFSYRAVSIANNKFSTWSLLTNPMPVALNGVDDGVDVVLGGIPGAITNKKIQLSITGALNSDIYDAIQIAVIKNIDGSATPDLKAFALNPSTDIFDSPSLFYYTGDSEEAEISIDDIIVETAAIQSIKTLTLKNNRLIGGNIKYSPLDYDRGAIGFDDAYTIAENIGHGGFRQFTEVNANSGSITIDEQFIVSDSGVLPDSSHIEITSSYTGNIFGFSGTYMNADPFTGDWTAYYVAKDTDTLTDIAYGLYLSVLAVGSDPQLVITVSGPIITIKNLSTSDNFQLYTPFVRAGYNTTSVDAIAPYAYKNENNTYSKRSHFRGELYRYAISYVDRFGNWSNGQVLDFSDFSIFRSTGTSKQIFSVGQASKTTIEGGVADGLFYIEALIGDVASIVPGSYILLSNSGISGNNGYFKVVGKNGTLIYLEGELTIEGTLGQVPPLSITFNATEDGKYSHSESSDWKFPSRDTNGFEILNSDSEVQSLGLRINGIINHPTWAVGFSILRAKRRKNIIFQSPHITTVAIRQSRTEGDFSFDGNTNGIYGIKALGLGSAKNIGLEPNTINNEFLESSYVLQTGVTNPNSALIPVSFIVPPDYLFNTNNQSFSDYVFDANDYVNVVDACSFNATGNITYGLGAGNPDESIALNFYAESKDNYYYNSTGKNLLQYYNQFKYFFNGGRSIIKEVGNVQHSDVYSFSYFPNSDNPNFGFINKFGDYESLSTSKTGSTPISHKGIALGLSDNFGDLTNISLETTNTPTSHLTNEIVFDSPVDDDAAVLDGVSYFGNLLKQPSQKATSSTVIINIEKGLNDFRYGDQYNYNEFIFTGSFHALTPSEVANNTPIDIDVFGGDCFISKVNIKLSDTRFIVGAGDGVMGGSAQLKKRAYGLPDFIEIISCYLESEVNCEFNAQTDIVPVSERNDISVWRANHIYPYNNGYSIQNVLKIIQPEPANDDNKTSFPARLIYSDQKIYQTNIFGFDVFRADSVYDQDETFGAITKIVRSGDDNIYSLQENGVSLIPIGASIIEDLNGQNLSIRSGDIIGTPRYVTINSGCQHIGTVQVSDKDIFYVDAKNANVMSLGGRISDFGMIKYFTQNLSLPIPENKLFGYYDYKRNEYIVSKKYHTNNIYIDGVVDSEIDNNSFVAVYNNRVKKWTTELSTSDTIDYMNMVYAGNGLYLIGKDFVGDIVIHKMYSGDRGKILGEIFDSEIEFVVNPMPDTSKVFSNLTLNSTNRAKEIDMIVYKENNTLQEILGMNFDVSPREGLYKIQILRDSSDARLRGLYAKANLKIDNTSNEEVRISSVITKYRKSYNII